jgi:membrane protein implicated in regulation of membrane protease activity
MFDKVLRGVYYESVVLWLVVSFSLVSASWLVTDAGISLSAEHYGWALMAFRLFELTFGALWVAFLAQMLREIRALRGKHLRIFQLHRLEKNEEEQKRSIATESVRDMLAFYRSYYKRVTAVLAVGIVVGVSVALTVTLLLFWGKMSVWEAVFRWGINSCMLLIVSILYIHLHRSWGRKLLKVEDAERKFSEILGGPVEA